jgi:hypothetical protein
MPTEYSHSGNSLWNSTKEQRSKRIVAGEFQFQIVLRHLVRLADFAVNDWGWGKGAIGVSDEPRLGGIPVFNCTLRK